MQPIIFYVDHGIPEPERSAIQAAALCWNHAFEDAGFENAFVLRNLPQGATFLDARYSGIQWISRADRSWSIGEFQADPRTGEILHPVARIDSDRRRTTARIGRNMDLFGSIWPGRRTARLSRRPSSRRGSYAANRLCPGVAPEVGLGLGRSGSRRWGGVSRGGV